jgi:hypothetical protein
VLFLFLILLYNKTFYIMPTARIYRRAKVSGIYLGPTLGKSSPKNSRRGCLCIDRDAYHVDCCKGYLINQGVGSTQSPPDNI